MKSYPNPLLSRDVMIAEAKAHREADRLIPGEYWTDGQGCSVGCSIETVNRRTGDEMSHADHAGLADALGIPEPLVQLQDAIFEGLPQFLRQAWPERFYTALPEGADLSGVWPLFAVWMLREVVSPVAGVNQAVVERVADGIETNWAYDDRVVAQAAARAGACGVAGCAAWAAEMAAKGFAANAVAGAVAGVAAKSIEDATWAAEVFVKAAAWGATGDVELVAARDAARAAWAAAKLAKDAAWTKMADRLCGLMAACGGMVA